jgi:DNA-binding XRE family transcriptional regulator
MPKKDQAPDPTLGPVLRQLRETRGEAREALAYRAGLTAGTLAEIELGRANPSWATVMQIIARQAGEGSRSQAEISAALTRWEGAGRRARPRCLSP